MCIRDRVIDDQRGTNEHAIWWTNRDLGQSQLDLFKDMFIKSKDVEMSKKYNYFS